MVTRALLPIALLTAVGCGAPTEVVVEVHADPGVEAAIDLLELRATDLEGEPRLASSNVGPGDYPRTIGLLESEGASGPITVVVTGRSEGTARVEAKARFSFTQGESRRLVIQLYDACLDGFTCSPETTCGASGACVPMDVRTTPR
jgi:hypothetical protein